MATAAIAAVIVASAADTLVAIVGVLWAPIAVEPASVAIVAEL
jgi:hypothetical protein